MDTPYQPDTYQNAVSETDEFVRQLLRKYPADAAALVLGVVLAKTLGESPSWLQNHFLSSFFADSVHPVTPTVMTLITPEPT